MFLIVLLVALQWPSLEYDESGLTKSDRGGDRCEFMGRRDC
jgi:hypothetical protein